MQRLCPRCHNAVTLEDSSSLIFCGHCGAPQIRLSEELLAQAEFPAEPTGAAFTPNLPISTVNWPGAVRCALLAGAIALALELLALALPAIGALSFFWAIGAPIVTLGIYTSRFHDTAIRPGFGARLGTLTGLAVMLGLWAVNVAGTLYGRFVSHTTAHFDNDFNTRLAQLKASTLQQAGSASTAQPMLNMLDNPEFRAGLLLAGTAMLIALYLVFSAAGGAFAAALRSKSPRRA